MQAEKNPSKATGDRSISLQQCSEWGAGDPGSVALLLFDQAAGDMRRERREELRRHLTEDADWHRADGRSFHDCRPAFMQAGPTTAASGSAYAEFGKTKVIVSVDYLCRFGPRESKKAMMYSDVGRLNCNVSYTTFATPVRGQGSDNKEYSSILHKALEDAGIMMYDLATSVSVNIIIDPTSDEEAWQDGSLMVAFMPARKEITQLTLNGEWSDGKITFALSTALSEMIPKQ
ncbi:exosome complex component RRP41-like [Phragmites australis]|uniref:exosome complex component RRP41-like n=1 Tax=Phragmites australis TaxID=29695 RepID=UPI002D76B1E0|nr:exosome complex component RRP41-like [Phragmites australis]